MNLFVAELELRDPPRVRWLPLLWECAALGVVLSVLHFMF